MKSQSLKIGLLGATAGALLAGVPAQAQTTPAPAPDSASLDAQEIVVTAQKRTENVQKVPIAITVVGGAQLQQQQINTVIDLRRSAPGIEFAAPGQSPGGGGFIRGLGTTITAASAEPSVGLVIDGVPQGNVPQSNLFDVSRVEILRGPQGTLFGQSVSAGVVNITTNAPDLSGFSAYAQGEIAANDFAGSGYDRRIGRLVVNAPLSSTAAIRVAGHFDSIDNVTKNRLTGQGSDRNDRGVRGRFLWEATDRLKINVIGDYNQINTRQEPYFSYLATSNPALISALAACGIAVGPDNNDTCTPVQQNAQTKQYGISGQLDYDLGGVTLTSITSHRWENVRQLTSIDGLPAASPSVPFPNVTFGPSSRDQKLFSQELRLSSNGSGTLEYVVGGFYSHYQQTYKYLSSLNLFFLPAPVLTRYTQTPDLESLAGFGQATLHLSDHLRLIGGARVTRNKVESNVFSYSTNLPYSNHKNLTNFSWRAGAQYDVTRNLMAYGTVSRGFKGQTFDDDSNPSRTPVYIKPEIPTAVEIGVKGSLLDRRLNFDLNLFHVNVHNYQAQVCFSDLSNSGRTTVCVPQNINKIVSKGVEFDLFGRPLPGLSINGGVAYVHAVYPDNYTGTDGSDLGGKQLINSARWKITASAEYEHQITNGLKAFVSADGVFRSRLRYYTIADDRVTYKPHWITGGRIGARTDDGKYELAVFARNLFNVHEPVLIYDSPIGATPGSPTTTQITSDSFERVVGLSGTVKF